MIRQTMVTSGGRYIVNRSQLASNWRLIDLLTDRYDRLRQSCIKFQRAPLALIATCAICDERTESDSIHYMTRQPQHREGCAADMPIKVDYIPTSLGEPS